MPNIQTYDVYTMLAAGATKTYVATDVIDIYEINANGGAITLLADMIFSYSGTPVIGSEFKFQYGGGVTSNTGAGITVTFFGTDLTDAQALAPLIILAYWNGTTWEINISKSDGTELLNPIVASGAGFTSTSSGTNPITYTGSSNLPNLNNVYVSKSGVDASGLVNRPDRPFLTIAAARTAAITLTPSALNRVRITIENGLYTNEQIVLYSYIDWDLGSSLIYQTTNTAMITDNNVAVTDCTIYGAANLLITSSSATASSLKAIYLQNSSSNVNIYCNNININSTGTPSSIYGALVYGNLWLYCNNITIIGTTTASIGIDAETPGTIHATFNDLSVTSTIGTGIQSEGASAKVWIKANNLSTIGTGEGWTIVSVTSAELYVKCNNIYNTGAVTGAGNGCAAVQCFDGTPKLYLECNDIIVTPSTKIDNVAIQFGYLTHPATTSGAIMSIKCRETIITPVAASTTNYAVWADNNTANAPVLMLSGRFKVVSASVVIAIKNTTGTLITQNVTLIPATTGAGVANGGLFKNYGSTVSTVASSGTAATVVGVVTTDALVV